MRTTLVTTALPNPDSGSGASITLALIASSLADRGQEVSICPLVYPEYVTPDGADYREQIEQAQALGYTVAPVVSDGWRPVDRDRGIASRLRRAWRPADVELYPQVRDAAAVRAVVSELGADAVLAYGFAALAATTEVAAPRFAATSDPPQDALRGRMVRRWREQRAPLTVAREAVALQAALRAYPRAHVRLLHDCEAVGAFAPHHADALRKQGIPCAYYRTPTADPGPPFEPPDNEVPRLLLIGHLQGTATLDGLRVFRAMLPHLERDLGPNGFEARIVGGYDPPSQIARILDHPAVRLVGFVEDVDEEFRRADVLLVPISIRLGVRVRILTGFSYGTCVVAHEANAFGIPELQGEANALLGSSPPELARAVVRAVRDPQLRTQLRAGARNTYERFFTPASAGGAIAETLETIDRRGVER
jgi:glycosyltransferase involved in cell wall biosynthesis